MLRNLGAASTWVSLLMLGMAMLLAAITKSDWARALLLGADSRLLTFTLLLAAPLAGLSHAWRSALSRWTDDLGIEDHRYAALPHIYLNTSFQHAFHMRSDCFFLCRQYNNVEAAPHTWSFYDAGSLHKQTGTFASRRRTLYNCIAGFLFNGLGVDTNNDQSGRSTGRRLPGIPACAAKPCSPSY